MHSTCISIECTLNAYRMHSMHRECIENAYRMHFKWIQNAYSMDIEVHIECISNSYRMHRKQIKCIQNAYLGIPYRYACKMHIQCIQNAYLLNAQICIVYLLSAYRDAFYMHSATLIVRFMYTYMHIRISNILIMSYICTKMVRKRTIYVVDLCSKHLLYIYIYVYKKYIYMTVSTENDIHIYIYI